MIPPGLRKNLTARGGRRGKSFYFPKSPQKKRLGKSFIYFSHYRPVKSYVVDTRSSYFIPIWIILYWRNISFYHFIICTLSLDLISKGGNFSWLIQQLEVVNPVRYNQVSSTEIGNVVFVVKIQISGHIVWSEKLLEKYHPVPSHQGISTLQ